MTGPRQNTRTRGPTRREALRLAGLGTSALVLAAGCDLFSTQPEKSGSSPEQTEPGRVRKQSPALDGDVKAGKLPPLKDRMPEKPMVIKPLQRTGGYGGTLVSQLDGMAAVNYKFYVELGYDQLVRWSLDWSSVEPNLVESWQIREDGKRYILTLRQGVKWSDGKPFTADDIVFSYDEVFANTELYPAMPSIFMMDDKPATLEKVDDHTVEFAFSAPSGLFLLNLATPRGRRLLRPRHYLEQFHKKFNPDGIEKLVESEGFSDWVELFGARDDEWRNPDRPSLNGWVISTPVGAGSGRAVFDRNPFYWKVDTDGRQLPYIDRATYRVLDSEVVLLRTASGEIDLNSPQPSPSACTLKNKPTLARSRKDGGYRFIKSVPADMNQMVISFNLNHSDEQMRRVFQNRDFRIGMSHALDRNELIETVFQRQGEPWQAAPRRESGVFSEELAKQYTRHDVDKANGHLDRASLDERDGSGFRLRPDGKRVAFGIDVITQEPSQILCLELAKKHWAEVGVDIRVKTMDRTLFVTRRGANKYDASVWQGGGGSKDAILDPRWYFPFSTASNYAPLWAAWYQTGGKEGDEPPEPAVRQMELYDQVRGTVEEKRRTELFMQMLEIAQEQFWALGTVLSVGSYGTAQTSIGNIPESMPNSWLYPTPGPSRLEQYYFEEG